MAPFRHPDYEKIACRNCHWRAEDRFNGQIPGATLALCAVYQHKPFDILWKNMECPYYVKDGSGETEPDVEKAQSSS